MAERKESAERHGVIFALVKDGLIQLEERVQFGKWFGLTIVPGGHVEQSETVEEAIFREVKEEYNSTPVEYKYLGHIMDTDSNLNLHIRHVYLITDWEGELLNPEGRNNHISLSIEDAEKICTHPISQKALSMINDELSRQD